MSKFIPKLITIKKPRSNFNLGRVNKFSCSPMLAIPVAWEEVLPDDTFITEYITRVTTESLLSPALGQFKVSIHQFFAPFRLYSSALRENRVGSLFDRNLQLPYFQFAPLSAVADRPPVEQQETVATAMVKPSSLFDYLGFPPGFVNLSDTVLNVSALPMLAYYDIVRNYFVHQQSGVMRVMTQEPTDLISGSVPYVDVDLNEVDNFMRGASTTSGPPVSGFAPIGWPMLTQHQSVFGGLCCTTFMPDQFQNYLDNDTVANLRSLAKVDVVRDNNSTGDGHITIDDLRFANKLQRYLELSVLGGNSRYSDWLHAHWGVVVDMGIVKPEYLGTTTSFVKFGQVISTSNTPDSTDDSAITGLGTRGGIGSGYGNGRTRKFHFKENGIYMAIMTIVPEIDYSQGIRKSLLKTNFSDIYVPDLDGIGFQDIAMSEVNCLPNALYTSDGTFAGYYPMTNESDPENLPLSTDPFTQSLGKQPPWMEYMTTQNELHGRLAVGQDLNYWSIGRDFTREVESQSGNFKYHIRDFSPYGLPWEFNYLFNVTDKYQQNFIVEVKADIIAKRQKSKNIRPSL